MQRDQGRNNTNQFSTYTITASATRRDLDTYVHLIVWPVATGHKFATCVRMLGHYHRYSSIPSWRRSWLRQQGIA
jgi:hypothetical protein